MWNNEPGMKQFMVLCKAQFLGTLPYREAMEQINEESYKLLGTLEFNETTNKRVAE